MSKSPNIGANSTTSPSSTSSSSWTRRTSSYSYRQVILILASLVFSLVSVHRLELSRYLNASDDASFVSRLGKHHQLNGHGPVLLLTSPACRPHFQVALPQQGKWTNETKFTRLYFYHVRKAGVRCCLTLCFCQIMLLFSTDKAICLYLFRHNLLDILTFLALSMKGTSLRRYFEKVAAHHGLDYKAEEYGMAEDPSSHDEATLYVTHLREPISRSISHFKYEGRWNCNNLMNDASFVPTEENAEKLETWNQTHGHFPASCLRRHAPIMITCAVNCYCQWFSGSCPTKDSPQEVPMTQQYAVAKDKLLRYNFIVITEMLQNPNYVDAVERFFGVPGLIPRQEIHPWCEVESHYSNQRVPLLIQNETLDRLTQLNEIDIGLYHEITDCMHYDGAIDFPEWDANRFETNETIQVDHDVWERQNPIRGYPVPPKIWLRRFNDSSSSSSESAELLTKSSSPACEPNFRVALPDGGWTESTKFTRLYFYHSRKAGGTNLKRYFQKVAAHHGLTFDSDEFSAAEDPESADESTFYVTHLREPVSRSLSHFKYEGRWNCNQLLNNESFVPSEENAQTLEDWINNYGENNNSPNLCAKTSERGLFFHMVTCAVNCYTQWISGLSCTLLNPTEESKEAEANLIIPLTRQHQVAKAKLRRYNFIVISEMLQNKEYVAAVERLFGVPGVAQKSFSPWCEAESHYANEMFPLVVETDILKKLTIRNRLDINLYEDFTNCLNESGFAFPAWRENRFEMNETIQLDYNLWDRRNRHYWPSTPKRSWLDKFKNSSRATY